MLLMGSPGKRSAEEAEETLAPSERFGLINRTLRKYGLQLNDTLITPNEFKSHLLTT
ncbi:hypothetical protein D3C74_263850 [compost metagenome]